ncbi:MAG: hypothetical protein ACJA1Z_002231, partial [Patiriisocius sp.]
LYTDSTYNLDLSANTGWSNNDFAAWIDFNGDADFDASERILYDPNSGGGSTNNFTVPSNAKVGDTVTMRVRLSYWSNPVPCGDQFGEVEDYVVFLRNTTTAVGDVIVENEFFSLYPSPNSGQFKVKFTEEITDSRLLLINSFGAVVNERRTGGKETITFDLQLPNGIYFIQLVESNKTMKFVIEN